MAKNIAYSPSSLSFIFRKITGGNLLKTGSIGIGCTLDKGVTAQVKRSRETKIFLNGKVIKFPTVAYALRKLTDNPFNVDLTSPLPLGFGFGISAASTLACLIAANQLLAKGKSRKAIIEIAHKAELVNHTGLGSVGTQATGGFLIKKSAGIPFESTSLPFAGKKLYAIVLGKLETPTVVSDNKRLQKINQAADKILEKIVKMANPTLSEILDCSYDFAQESLLLDTEKIAPTVEKIKKMGGHATMAMLGNVVISSINFQIKNYPTYSLTISSDKVRIL
jgi:pantoate kinase